MKGLTDAEVKINRKTYGENVIYNEKGNSFIRLLIESLGDPIIKILLIALGIKSLLFFKSFDWYETIGIVVAIALASFISAISEYGSNKAFQHLQNETNMAKVKVLREGKIKSIFPKDIVYNDIIKISSGEKIFSDGVLIDGKLSVDESFLTGESKEIYKNSESILTSKILSGSSVFKGDGMYRTTAVGKNTVMGLMTLKLQDDKDDSPLKIRLRALASQISKLGYWGAVLACLTYLFFVIFIENKFNMTNIIVDVTSIKFWVESIIYCLTLAVTIIIMAVPEGLPMMITLVLSSNMKKMLKSNVLVKKLAGIEASGSLNILLCDKTGTLTTGKLSVEKIILANGKEYQTLDSFNNKAKILLINSMKLNNDSVEQNGVILGGNSTDQAIAQFISGYDTSDSVISKNSFSSETKYSSVQLSNNCEYYKGAYEVLLKKCNSFIDDNGDCVEVNFSCIRNEIIKKIKEESSQGYRVLICCVKFPGKQNLSFLSSIIISDKIRDTASSSINLLQNSGIKVIMITGDAKDTALTIAEKLSLGSKDDLVLSHSDITRMSEEELLNVIQNIRIVARALPDDKEKIVNICKKKGLVVGMTGDGINDTMALRKSDVGFAMGSGCDVAKEAGDIVIMDNNIQSICNAVLYGRTIFKSIRKFVTYQLTVNVCALILSILGPLIGLITPITIVQMLWLNMIMDTFAGLAFSYEPANYIYYEELPKPQNEKVLNKYMINQITINGIVSAVICIMFIKLPIVCEAFRDSPNSNYLLTGFFALFIFLGIINAFLSRSASVNPLKDILSNKLFIIINVFILLAQLYIIYFGGNVFRTYGLLCEELLLTIAFSFLIIPIDTIRKLIYLKKYKKIDL